MRERERGGGGSCHPVLEEHKIITMIIILCMLEGSPIERIIIIIELMIRKLITVIIVVLI